MLLNMIGGSDVTKIDKHIEIVRSTKAGLNSMSTKSAHAIAMVLAKVYSQVDITVVNDIIDLDRLVARRPDLVFLGMKFIPSDPELGPQDPVRIWLASYLDKHAIAYTGSEYKAYELEYNKPLAKQHVINASLATSPFIVIKHGQAVISEMPLDYPVFIKPVNRGGGQGIDCDSVAYGINELQAKVQSISTDIGTDSLIEEFLPGREFSVAILKDMHSDSFLVLPIEKVPPLDTRGKRILSQKIKLANSVTDLVVKEGRLKTKITELAIKAFHALGARDYGRIDIRLNQRGIPQFLEANLIPSLIDGYGSFPKSCMMNLKMNHEVMILRITQLGLCRTASKDITESRALPYRLIPKPIVA